MNESRKSMVACRVSRVAFILAALLLSGCDNETTLHSGLAERQANLVMAALLDAGISCHKAPGDEGTWDVTVVESRFAETIKNARYKKDELFYDEMVCHYGIEFKTWIINNNDHSFTYDKDNQTVCYNGRSPIYPQLHAGVFTYDEFNNMLSDSGWIGSYPLYAFEEYPSKPVQDEQEIQNEQVLCEQELKEQQEDLLSALEAAN